MQTELVLPDQGEQRRSSLLLWLVVLFLGSAALGAWFLIGPALGAGTRYYKVGYNRTAYEYSRALIALFAPYGLALYSWHRGARIPLWVLLGGAAVLHLLVLFAPLPQSQDLYQYLFYGRMQAVHHANPFVVNPSTFWADPWFPWIRWNAQASVYGPAWILLSFGVSKVAGSSLAVAFVNLKVIILAMDATVVWLLYRLAADRPDPEGSAGWSVLAYAWNPLVLITVPLAGSADVAVVAAFLGAMLARRRGRTGIATVLLTLASLVKVYAVIGLILHLVLVLRERGVRRSAQNSAGAAALIALAYAPYWAGRSTFHGLVQAAGLRNQSFTGTVERLLIRPGLLALGYHTPTRGSQLIGRWAAGAILLAVAVWAIAKVRDEQTLWHGIVAVLMAYLLLTPWFLYWYILGPLAVAVVIPRNRLTYPLLTFSATALITVYFPSRPTLWAVQTILRYAPPFAVYAAQGWPERARITLREGAVLSIPHPAPTPSPAPVMARRAPAK